MDNDEQQTEQHRYCAEVYLKEGGQNYTMRWVNQEQLINDILDQYEAALPAPGSLIATCRPGVASDHPGRNMRECRMISRWKWMLKQTIKKLWFFRQRYSQLSR